MKADILRRVREQAEDEEEADRVARAGVLGGAIAPAPVIVAYEEELSDTDREMTGPASIKISGHYGEIIEEEDGDVVSGMPANV